MSTLFFSLYSVSAVRAMQTAVLARQILLSVRPSFHHVPVLCPDNLRYTIVWFSASGRAILLVSEKVKFIWIFAGDHP